jgi:hypothetical protein
MQSLPKRSGQKLVISGGKVEQPSLSASRQGIRQLLFSLDRPERRTRGNVRLTFSSSLQTAELKTNSHFCLMRHSLGPATTWFVSGEYCC